MPAHRLAQRLLQYETGNDAGPAALAEATARVCTRLYGQLARLVGPAGCDLLLTRAISVASAECPALATVRWVGSAGRLEGLRAALPAEPDPAAQACVALLGAFLALVIDFIGEDLTLRQVSRAWPDLPPGAGPAGSSPGGPGEEKP